MERRFTFSYGTQQVAVDWAVVAVAIDGQLIATSNRPTSTVPSQACN